MIQHAMPWPVPLDTTTPVLWLAGEKDTVIPEFAARHAAQPYHADYRMISGAGHNLMMERSERQIVEQICGWLEAQALA